MSTIELRKRLIDTIQKTDNEKILEDAYRLFSLETDDTEIFILSDAQKQAITESKQQIHNGQFLTDEQANKEIDEWLNP